MPHSPILRRLLALGLGTVFVVSLAGLRLGFAYWAVEREEFDPDAARQRIEAAATAQPFTQLLPGDGDDPVDLEVNPLALTDLDFELQNDGVVHENPDLPAPIVLPDMSSPAVPDEKFRSYLLIGADLSGYLADTIILVLAPADADHPHAN